jgi:hypothetical protein
MELKFLTFFGSHALCSGDIIACSKQQHSARYSTRMHKLQTYFLQLLLVISLSALQFLC